jgi:TP901 family phage tail tape measure protein
VAFGSDRSVKLTVAASMDGFARELARGERAGQQFSRGIVASTKAAAKSLHDVKDSAKEVAVPLLAVGTIAAAGVAYAVKSYADFDEKMSSVKSLSHATAGEMEQLKSAALTTGTAIGFSATQAADAEIELVKAGVSASDIYGGALAGSLKLAAAGQIDVADATSIASATMVQFGLKGSDVTHIADLLAAGADKALGGVSDLGEGLKYIGPVAASSNVSLEQTVGTMALLAQNGILGEQAGTSLRGMLLSLTAPSKVAARVMQEYGIQVYDAQGKFIGFNGVAGQLHDKLGTLDDATRDAALGQIFGNAQITAATVLMKGGAKEVDKWTKAVNEQGFATEQAVGKMDNLNGDLTKLKASFQTAAIVTGEAADGPLRAAVQVITDLIEAYTAAPSAMQGVVLGTTALTAAVALGSGTLLIAVPKVVEFGKALRVLASSDIPGISTAAAGALKSTSLLGRGLGSTASLIAGPFGLALGVAALAVNTFNLAAASGSASQEDLAAAIERTAGAAKLLQLAGQRSDFSKFLIGDVGEQLKDIPALLDRTTDGAAQFWSMVSIGAASSDQKTQQALKSLRDIGDQLGTVAAADAPAAARSFAQLAKSQNLTNGEMTKLLNGPFKEYRAQLMNQASALGITADKQNLLKLATGQYQEAALTATNPTKENSDALNQLQASGEDAAKAIEDTANALKGLTSPTLDAREAQRQFQAAVDGVTQSVKDNGTSLDTSTDKGRANEAALDAIAQAAENAAGSLYTQTGSQDVATAAMQKGRDELIAALGQYGITGAAAQDYANKILGTPTDWATTFQNNAPGVGSQVDSLKSKILSIPAGKTITITAQTAAAQGELDSFIRRNDGRVISVRQVLIQQAVDSGAAPGVAKAAYNRASGGPVYGPGSGTSDDIPAWLSNGEWVIRERSSSMYGPQIMHAINQGMLSKQQLMAAMSGRPGFANGGPVAPTRYAAPSPVINVAAPAGPSSLSLAGARLSLSVDGRQMTAFVQEQVLAHDAQQERRARQGKQVR